MRVHVNARARECEGLFLGMVAEGSKRVLYQGARMPHKQERGPMSRAMEHYCLWLPNGKQVNIPLVFFRWLLIQNPPPPPSLSYSRRLFSGERLAILLSRRVRGYLIEKRGTKVIEVTEPGDWVIGAEGDATQVRQCEESQTTTCLILLRDSPPERPTWETSMV